MPLTQRRDALKLRPGEDPSAGIGRSIEDDGAGSRVERPPQTVEIERLPRKERHIDRRRVAENGVRAVVLVERLEDDDLVARIHEGQQRRDHRFGRAAGHGDLRLRIHGHAVPLGVLPRQRLTEPSRAPGDRVLIDVVVNGARRGFLENLGRRKVGEPLRQVDGSMLRGQTGHATDDRLAEGAGATGRGRGHAGDCTTRSRPRESEELPSTEYQGYQSTEYRVPSTEYRVPSDGLSLRVLAQPAALEWFLATRLPGLDLGMPGVRRFEDLVVWRGARRLAFEVHLASAAGRAAHDYELVNQLRRSAISIASNIAEGFERKRASSFAQFLEYSRGSCAELRAQLYLANDVGWLGPAELERLMALADHVARMLGALHQSQARRPQ